MIICVNLNASVDKLYQVDSMVPGTVMRVKTVVNTPGGKGLNVARVAAKLGEKVIAIGFLGGFNGGYVLSMLKQEGVQSMFTLTDAETRSCINIHDASTGKHTEFLEPGCEVSLPDQEKFLAGFEALLPDCNIVSVSGSLPKGIAPGFYAELIKTAKKFGKKLILDSSGEALKAALREAPFMIKPNREELGQLLASLQSSTAPESREQLYGAMESLGKQGVEIVALSLGKEGVLVRTPGGLWHGITPDIPVVNTVGCGDSMLAGFAAGFNRNWDIEKTIALATAVSTANALVAETGSFRQDDLDRLLKEVKVIRVS